MMLIFGVQTLRLVAGKKADAAVAASKEMNNKKRPISRSSRASLQVDDKYQYMCEKKITTSMELVHCNLSFISRRFLAVHPLLMQKIRSCTKN
ncbi:hypothetical protein ACET3Z_000390 [Daucus carota]